MLSEKSDEELMIAYQLGEAQAFEELYSRHAPKVLGFLRKKVRTEAVAQDIFQAAFLKLHRSKSRYDAAYPFLPWLFTICRSELLDALKKPHLAHETISADPPELVTSEPASDREISMRTLPANQRKAMELRYHQDFSFEEIAASLETSPANARQLVSRAIRSLRSLYGK